MTRQDKLDRLKVMLQRLSKETDPKTLARQRSRTAGLESMDETPVMPAANVQAARSGVDKVLTGKDSTVTDQELNGLEAIVMKEGRPVVFIRSGKYDDLPDPWTHLNDPAVRARLQPLFASIGRVDLPNSSQIPYGGTGFVVGPGLLMTNRHVAALFTTGLGLRNLLYTAGDAAIDFKREVTDRNGTGVLLEVRKVVMVHPYWDMSLLQVEGLGDAHPVLKLSVTRPDDLVGQDVVAVGYPARDPRNDAAIQNQIFEGVYDVKRFQPGKLRQRESIRSFETTVSAATHDSSTLGGNSGSAVLNVATGEVVALHFAGLYLKANYAVPTYELARDPRVVEAGLNFASRVPSTNEFDEAWIRIGQEGRGVRREPVQVNGQQAVQVTGGTANWTIPINVAVSIGTPVPTQGAAPAVVAETEARMVVPFIYPDLESRTGYRPDFLGLSGGEKVPLPELTEDGKRVAAQLEDESTEIKYHRFSVILHKKRRLAILAASNVNWRRESREIDGRKPSRRELTGLPKNAQEKWTTDPRLPDRLQLPDVFYTKDGGAFDKGHIVRRDDVAWGDSFEDMQMGNGDTYHTTNCSPQVAGFNRSGNEDNWGDLENLVQRQTRSERVCIFAGPVLDDGDRWFQGRDERGPTAVQIPQKFWKIIVANGDQGPRAYGFVLEQDLSDVPLEIPLEFVVPQPWKRYMQSVADIEQMLGGWVKLTWLKDRDGFETEEGQRIATGARTSGNERVGGPG
jgi:endonuclease G, mitochondrial